MARKTRPMPPPPTYSTRSKCPIRSPGITRPSRIRAVESEAAGAGIGGELLMIVRSSAGGLPALRAAPDEPSARTGSRSPCGGETSGFRASEAESFIRLLSRNRRRDSAAVHTGPGPSLLHIHVVRITRPLGRTPDKKSSSISQKLHFSRSPSKRQFGGSIGGGERVECSKVASTPPHVLPTCLRRNTRETSHESP
jgi:hypothetical protein